MDGRQVRAAIKADTELRRIPVIVLTTSRSAEDILCAYELNANCYVPKPLDLDQFIEVMKIIDRFWFGIAELPSA
jgi:CheY-like chemotaxis protein